MSLIKTKNSLNSQEFLEVKSTYVLKQCYTNLNSLCETGILKIDNNIQSAMKSLRDEINKRKEK